MKYILILVTICFPFTCFAQEITEENFRKADSVLWNEYMTIEAQLTQLGQKYPEKKDSLLTELYGKLLPVISRKNRDLAIQYASVPSGLERLFQVRLDVSKDTLSRVFNLLPEEIQKSFYGKCLHQHIVNKQIKIGDPLFDFKGVREDTSEFRLSDFKGKKLLFIYGGLGCMGAEGRKYLASLYQKTSRQDFEIIVFWPCSSIEELQEAKKQYSCDYVLVADFLLDESPVKIIYGTQATPTCFFIDSEGIIKMRSEGLDPDKCEQLLSE